MSKTTILALAAALALSASAASAQTNGLTNGPNGNQPNGLASHGVSGGANSAQPSRAIMNPRSSMYNSGARLLHPRKRHQRH